MDNQQPKNSNAPRITEEHLDSVIVSAQYWQPEGTTLTVCALTLKNGTHVIGESACVSPENFNAELGRKYSFEKARREIWDLEGYLLKQSLSNAAPDPLDLEPLQVGDKVIAIKGANRPGVNGVVEIIRSQESVGVRTPGGSLWHEAAINWKKVV